MEHWKGMIYAGEDYSEWLEISNLGRVRNPKTGTIRKQNLLKTGYLFVSFSMGSRGKKKTIRVHKAIAETWIPNPEGKPIVNHIDGNKENNSLENLEWATYRENASHAIESGLVSQEAIDRSARTKSKLTEEEVIFIRKNYISGDKVFGSRALGRHFNISHKTILNIVSKKSYRWVK